MMENNELSADLEKILVMPLTDRKKYAKEMYWQYSSIVDISKHLAIKLPTVKSWVYGQNSPKDIGWKNERELSKNQLLKDLSADKRGMVYNMVNGSLYLIYDFVEKTKREVIQSGKKVDIRTAEKLTNILGSLHKIVQDETNDDDVTFTKPANPRELKERLEKADPFTPDEEDDVIVAGDLK